MAHFKGYAGGWVDADEGLVTLHPSMAQGGGEVTSVSYTHLDVYKRQVEGDGLAQVTRRLVGVGEVVP